MEGKEDGLQLGTELKLGRLEETIDELHWELKKLMDC